jgi:hypothetical protein
MADGVRTGSGAEESDINRAMPGSITEKQSQANNLALPAPAKRSQGVGMKNHLFAIGLALIVLISATEVAGRPSIAVIVVQKPRNSRRQIPLAWASSHMVVRSGEGIMLFL